VNRFVLPLLLLLCWFGSILRAQDAMMDPAYRQLVVTSIVQLLKSQYVFPDVANQMVAAITTSLQNGSYGSISSAIAFADRLTQDLQAISHDKHLRVVYRYKQFTGGGTPGNSGEQILVNRFLNDHFQNASRLDGNIGYVRLDGFSDPNTAVDTIARAMDFVANTGALIIDARLNPGGNALTVPILESYFFDGKVHIEDFYYRDTGQTISSYTLDQVQGERYLNKNVYILTSAGTFSGGEQFAYDLQAQKRAQIVGEVTGGGANPGNVDPIDDSFGIFVPFGRPINPVTGTNWEGVGVRPDIAATADLALKVAHLAALQKLVSEGIDRPPQEVTEIKTTIARLQRDIIAANIINTRCPPSFTAQSAQQQRDLGFQVPAITGVSDAGYGDNIVSGGVMVVWGLGFTSTGGNSIQLVQDGGGSAQFNERNGLTFDRSSGQINVALAGNITPGQWALVANNGCGVSSAPFPVTIH
jgi:hypothetical protein